MANMKRISSITIKRILDESPDTSHLGEYSSSPSGDYSIDRKHDSECNINQVDPFDVESFMDDVDSYLYSRLGELSEIEGTQIDAEYAAISEARDIVADSKEDTENGAIGCTCGGVWIDRHSCEFFNTSGNYKGESLEDIRTYTIQDYKRMESLNAGDWSYIGIMAEAEIIVNGVSQTVASGGLWGVESDSDASYFSEIEGEELSQLRTTLYELGFSKRSIATACKEIEHVEK